MTVWPATRANIRRAARLLKKGGLVAFPTETVYGLGADALNAQAVCRIFTAKKRPAFDPLIVHAVDAQQAFSLCRQVPPQARVLAEHFWPGPLTLVLPKKTTVPDVVTAGLDTVAVRVPAHPVARELLRCFGGPIAAPSANRFGRTSPTTADMVAENLGKAASVILDGGASRVGVESTVLGWDGKSFTLLRPGGTTVEALKTFVRIQGKTRMSKAARRSPGLLKSHYAPQTPLILMPGSYSGFVKMLRRKKKAYTLRAHASAWPRLALLSAGPRKKNRLFAAAVALDCRGRVGRGAARLFQAMHKLDKMNCDFIVAERVASKGLGLAVMDRLKRASAHNTAKAIWRTKRHGIHGHRRKI